MYSSADLELMKLITSLSQFELKSEENLQKFIEINIKLIPYFSDQVALELLKIKDINLSFLKFLEREADYLTQIYRYSNIWEEQIPFEIKNKIIADSCDTLYKSLNVLYVLGGYKDKIQEQLKNENLIDFFKNFDVATSIFSLESILEFNSKMFNLKETEKEFSSKN